MVKIYRTSITETDTYSAEDTITYEKNLQSDFVAIDMKTYKGNLITQNYLPYKNAKLKPNKQEVIAIQPEHDMLLEGSIGSLPNIENTYLIPVKTQNDDTLFIEKTETKLSFNNQGIDLIEEIILKQNEENKKTLLFMNKLISLLQGIPETQVVSTLLPDLETLKAENELLTTTIEQFRKP